MSIHYEFEKISSNVWYCPERKKRVTPKPPIDYETLNNGKEVITGFCPYCGSKIHKVIG